ncbi:MAG: LytTR family transcriptional regulator DNA-binding domain-containing protein [Bacteroidota bacterium]
MIRTVIIDDEPLARDIIKTYLKNHSDIDIMRECEDGFQGIKAINELNPDLVFLDIQMPKITGFEMLELLEKTPVIIFSTAYDQYAIKAFEANATDYLLKPYAQTRFDEALQKAREKLNNKSRPVEDAKELVEKVRENYEELDRIVVKVGHKIHILPIESIHYFEAQDDYVAMHTAEQKFLKQMTMKYLESHLSSDQFVRIHRSYIVAVNEIARLEHYEKDSYMAILKDGKQLSVSRAGHIRLKEALKI